MQDLYSVSYTNGPQDHTGSCSTFRTREEAEACRRELVRDGCNPGPVYQHATKHWVETNNRLFN